MYFSILTMLPTNLTPGKLYSFTPEGKEPVTLVYQYETLNNWAFTAPGIAELILLQKHQIKELTEI